MPTRRRSIQPAHSLPRARQRRLSARFRAPGVIPPSCEMAPARIIGPPPAATHMRREDIDLRNAARGGDPAACLAMAERLFTGARGVAQNHRLGLAYLQQE